MDPITRQLIKWSGRSWWQCEYSNGNILSEWDTLTGKILTPIKKGGSTSRWEEIPKENMLRLRLFCPNGQLGQVESKEGRKFFQLKIGGFMVGEGQYCDAHIIGVVINDKGDCNGWAWEKEKFTVKTRLTNKLNADLIKKSNKFYKVQVEDAGMNNGNCWVTTHDLIRPNRLHGFLDNVYNMKYENLGNLNLDVQRLKI